MQYGLFKFQGRAFWGEHETTNIIYQTFVKNIVHVFFIIRVNYLSIEKYE